MRKSLLITALSLAVTFMAGAQLRTSEMIVNSKKTVLDHAVLECAYEHFIKRDTVKGTLQPTEDMILRIGPGFSAFYSYGSFMVDSTMVAESIGDIAKPKYKLGTLEYIYKDRVNSKLIGTDVILGDYYRYEDELEPQLWTITGETREIIGYECIKAVCDWRGRRYEAWFAPEIPIMEGPWKFHGLPGIILDVGDIAGHYAWRITGIRELEGVPIVYPEYTYIRATRKEVLKLKWKAEEDPYTQLRLKYGSDISIITMDEHGNHVDISNWNHDPQYDFIERDYR